MNMGEAIPTRSLVEQKQVGGGAIPVDYQALLKEDLQLGAQFLLAKKSPLDILQDAIDKEEWFKGIVLSAAFFEHFGSLKLKKHFQGRISEEKINDLSLARIIIFLFGLELMSQTAYAMIEVKDKRNDLVHKPFAEVNCEEAKHLIHNAIDCLKELGL
jgi:hypothetical protein